MFYIWGSGGGRAVASDGGMRMCPICDSAQAHDLVVTYRYWHFWYLISFVVTRTYSFVCRRCGNGVVAQPVEYRDKLDKDPIPFLRRRGWTIPVFALVPLIAFGMYASSEDSKKVAALLETPRVGDVYSVDLAHVSDSFGGKKHAYGDMKLLAIADGKARFTIAKEAWGKKYDLYQDERRNDIHSDDYYDSDDVVELDLARLKALRVDGSLFDIHRKP
jgi:hypothetical protein